MNCLLCLVLALGCSASQEAPSTEAAVELKQQALARGRRLQLGDLAEVKSDDAALAERLRQIDLGLPPAEGWGRRVPRALVEHAIQEAGLPIDAIRLGGASESEVFSSSAHIRPEEIEHAAEIVLRAALAALGEDDVEWVLARRAAPRRVPVGRIGVDLAARLRQGRVSRDQALVDVTVRVDGESYASIPVVFSLRRYREVLVSLTSNPAGSALDEGRIALRRVDLSRFFGEPLDDPALVTGKVAARNLSAGAILTVQDIKDPELIRSGEMITVVAVRGNLRVTARGVAAQGGSLGEVIRIVNPATKRVIHARVAGPGVAEIVTN